MTVSIIIILIVGAAQCGPDRTANFGIRVPPCTSGSISDRMNVILSDQC